MRGYVRLAALFWLAACHATPAAAADSPAVTSSPQTCRSGAVNYITHTLPQQCLKSYTVLPDPNRQIPRTAGISSSNHTASPSTQDHNSTSHDAPHRQTSSSRPAASTSTSTDTASVPNESTQPVPTASRPPASSASSASSTEQPVNSDPSDPDNDSPLDHAQFLSFEDWKKQNLEKVGQSVHDLNQPRPALPGSDRQRPGVENALDGLGDDSEIEIDFGGFASGPHPTVHSPAVPPPAGKPAVADGSAQPAQPSPAHFRNKDAGKTCKERFNHASFDCAANILKTNPQCKSANSVLVENKDSYMLNKCSLDNKFLIVELCDAVLIDTVVLANFEFFSSMFRAFRISVSDRYPVKLDKWRVLGTYEARNTREIQAFLVENPQIYARYLRVEFMTHYGAEYYCPLSLLRVHGTTMMEEYRRELAIANGEIEEDEDTTVVIDSETPPSPLSSVSEAAAEAPKAQPSPPFAVGELDLEEPAEVTSTSSTISSSTETISPSSESVKPVQTQLDTCQSTAPTLIGEPFSFSAEQTCPAEQDGRTYAQSDRTTDTAVGGRKTATSSTVNLGVTAAGDSSSMAKASVTSARNSNSTSVPSSPAQARQASSGASSTSVTTTTPMGSSGPSSNVNVAAAQPPATQESFFKSIHKRLQALEANSTLSLQYIESQSKLLRQAFEKVEKRNVQKASNFLEALNRTVLTELSRFREEYEQLWQSTVIELANQREEGNVEREVMGERIRMLAEEMVAQKRLMAAQATLLLVGLGIVAFGRYGVGSGVDIALAQGVQGLVHKGRSFKTDSMHLRGRWQWDSPWGSPPRSRGGEEATGIGGSTPSREDDDVVDDDDSEHEAAAVEQEEDEAAMADEANGDAAAAKEGQLRRLVQTKSAPTTPRGLLGRDVMDGLPLG